MHPKAFHGVLTDSLHWSYARESYAWQKGIVAFLQNMFRSNATSERAVKIYVEKDDRQI